MAEAKEPEVWLQGPLPGITPYLQPVAHALLQARDEVNTYMELFPDDLLWQKPAGLASVGFHLQHLTGVLDRLFSYAKGDALTTEQLAYLKAEGEPPNDTLQRSDFVQVFNRQVDDALAQLRTTDEHILTHFRGVGRAGLPSTVLGLLVHAAEHTMRHVGQLLVTATVVKANAI